MGHESLVLRRVAVERAGMPRRPWRLDNACPARRRLADMLDGVCVKMRGRKFPRCLVGGGDGWRIHSWASCQVFVLTAGNQAGGELALR